MRIDYKNWVSLLSKGIEIIFSDSANIKTIQGKKSVYQTKKPGDFCQTLKD
jgi:hypothetical protein